MSLYESCDFSEGVVEVAKFAFSVERVYGQIFLTEFGWTFFAGFFPSLFFKERIHREKTQQKLKKINENSSKVRRNTSPQEGWKNYAKSNQSQTYTSIDKVNMLANTQNSIIISKGKDLKISKNRFNKYGGQVRSSTSKNIYISTVWIVGKFGTEQLGCWTSLFQHFRSSKFSEK